MRLLRVAGLGLIAMLPCPARAADPPRHVRAAHAATVRTGRVITLERAGGAYRSSGLWSETYELPPRTKLKAVRLTDPKCPGERCDIITQVRYADQADRWSQWHPANILPNAGFQAGPPRGCVLRKGRGAGEPRRYATSPMPRSGETAPMWRLPAPTGADVTLTAHFHADDGASRAGIGVECSTGAHGGVKVSALAPRTRPNAGWRRLSVGLSVPPAARTFRARGVFDPAAGKASGGEFRMADGALALEARSPAARVHFRADFSQPKAWKSVLGAPATWASKPAASATFALAAARPTAAMGRVQPVTLRAPAWVEIRAVLTVDHAVGAVNLLPVASRGAGLSLRCTGDRGTYRVWARAKLPGGGARLLLQAGLTGGKAGSVTFHAVELSAAEPPPAFRPRPPVGIIAFPRAVPARRLQIRSFLLTSDPKLTPSFAGYALETEP